MIITHYHTPLDKYFNTQAQLISYINLYSLRAQKMGHDHTFYVITVSNYNTHLKQALVNFYGEKDLDTQINEQKEKGTLTKQKLRQLISNFMEEYEQDDDESAYLNLKTAFKNYSASLGCFRNHYLRENTIKGIEYFGKAGISIKVTKKQYLLPQMQKLEAIISKEKAKQNEDGSENKYLKGFPSTSEEALQIYKKTISAMQNQGEEAFLVIETSY